MRIPVKTSSGGYDIVLSRGALSSVGRFFELNRKVLIVTDDGVPTQYPTCISGQCLEFSMITLPQGETSKSFDNLNRILRKMVEFNMTRTDCIVAVGGGVVGDIAGFAAAIYMRGIDFYNIPTTVLSQVDSSVGGKTAIDFMGYKNIVGAFYAPKGVLIDPETLDTLPERQISNGLAESVKMALTSDAELFSIFESGNTKDNIDTIIERSVYIKKNVVEQDEKEAGIRKILNFGHTIAHAIESENGLSRYYHGECVALGMIPMCSPEVREKLVPVLDSLSLPVNAGFDINTLISAMRHDKKLDGDTIAVITVEKIGSYALRNIPFSEFCDNIKKAVSK